MRLVRYCSLSHADRYPTYGLECGLGFSGESHSSSRNIEPLRAYVHCESRGCGRPARSDARALAAHVCLQQLRSGSARTFRIVRMMLRSQSAYCAPGALRLCRELRKRQLRAGQLA